MSQTPDILASTQRHLHPSAQPHPLDRTTKVRSDCRVLIDLKLLNHFPHCLRPWSENIKESMRGAVWLEVFSPETGRLVSAHMLLPSIPIYSERLQGLPTIPRAHLAHEALRLSFGWGSRLGWLMQGLRPLLFVLAPPACTRDFSFRPLFACLGTMWNSLLFLVSRRHTIPKTYAMQSKKGMAPMAAQTRTGRSPP